MKRWLELFNSLATTILLARALDEAVTHFRDRLAGPKPRDGWQGDLEACPREVQVLLLVDGEAHVGVRMDDTWLLRIPQRARDTDSTWLRLEGEPDAWHALEVA